VAVLPPRHATGHHYDLAALPDVDPCYGLSGRAKAHVGAWLGRHPLGPIYAMLRCPDSVSSTEGVRRNR
jgi:hypothetical protein